MSEMPISPLRRRMIEDMTVRQFVEKTQADYIRHVRTFTAFLGRSPDTATAEDLRRFQLHQAESGVRPPSMNSAVASRPRPTRAVTRRGVRMQAWRRFTGHLPARRPVARA